jgi:Zn-dependent M28 family amino/carboxypeptidase
VTPGAADDRVWNGADDDGSGTVALMALARAFVNGPRPKRSLVFVWHAGEERGLLGPGTLPTTRRSRSRRSWRS